MKSTSSVVEPFEYGITGFGGNVVFIPVWVNIPLTHAVCASSGSSGPPYARHAAGVLGGGTPSVLGAPPSWMIAWWALISVMPIVLLVPSVKSANRIAVL